MIKLEARDGYVYVNSDRSVIGRLIYLIQNMMMKNINYILRIVIRVAVVLSLILKLQDKDIKNFLA